MKTGTWRRTAAAIGSVALIGGVGSGCNLEPGKKMPNPKAEPSSSSIASPTPSVAPAPTAVPSSSPTEDPTAERKRLVREAERLVLAELPDIPIWEGTAARGHYVSDTEVCVDRVYGTTTSIGRKGESAGYVVVTFPEKSLGEPQDGKCATATPEPTLPPVDVPDDLKNAEGLLTRDDFGKDWPLTVNYVVVRCDSQSVIATAPDGKDYAVNGTAQSHHPDLPEIDGIWADDPDVDGLKIDISPIIDKGLELC